MKNYAHLEVLVDTQWVAHHLNDPKVRLLDVQLTPTAYNAGHVPGAVFWNAFGTILQPDHRTNFDQAAFEAGCSRSGIANDTTVIVYSDHSAVAPWVFWYFRVFGHDDVHVMN